MSFIESAIRNAKAQTAGESAQSGRATRTRATDVKPVALQEFLPAQTERSAMERNCILPQITDQSALRAYKILRTRLLQRMSANKWHALAVTGVDSGSGKSVTAVNLAIALAQDPNTSVVLVDLDLQRPKIAEYMGLQFGKGLGDYLLGEATLDEIFYSPGIERLAIVPNARACDRSSDLLSGARMLDFVQRVNSTEPRCIVVYDMPPLLMSDDVLTFVPNNADGVLLVVAEGRTERGLLQKSKDVLAEINVVGVVLNRSMERNESTYY